MNHRVQRPGRSKAIMTVAAIFAGGSTFTSCDTRVKTAVVSGLEQTFLNLLDPANFLADQAETDSSSSSILDR